VQLHSIQIALAKRAKPIQYGYTLFYYQKIGVKEKKTRNVTTATTTQPVLRFQSSLRTQVFQINLYHSIISAMKLGTIWH
jgi:hypothetical protein